MGFRNVASPRKEAQMRTFARFFSTIRGDFDVLLMISGVGSKGRKEGRKEARTSGRRSWSVVTTERTATFWGVLRIYYIGVTGRLFIANE